MRPPTHPRTSPVAEQDGFTLVELLVAMTVLVVVMLATLAALDSLTSLSHKETAREHALREAQVGVDGMVRELRHAKPLTAPGASSDVLTVDVVQRGTHRTVTFDCGVAHPALAGTKRCVRTEGTAASVVVDMLRPAAGDPPVFTFTPSAGSVRHVAVRARVRLDGGRSGGHAAHAVLRDGTELRNG